MTVQTHGPSTLNRRLALGLSAAAVLVSLSACGGAPKATSATGDMALGAAEGAAVTVVEYASVTCGHCAEWQETVWPAFKAKYVDTDQVRYVLREFPTAPQDIAVAGFLIARCAGDDKYFEVVDQVMRSQAEWATGTPPRDSLVRIAADAGLSDAQFQACVSDPQAISAMEQRIREAVDAGVTGTPTFIINGKKVEDTSLAGLSAVIDPQLRG
ncbi:DsbA family protein [Brevundimonas variabilis]|uniref:Protein-disulfide isomerase n=1 Tax=Brevundimonas variabilis TaxID=74312 RepID=A0A7W9CHL3_9CAUL|nr:DsbA family protein [Brevundimonas variabilis]MBB5745666.1 protein-disulfide isomerase [Brevundimonas variabilis]